MCRHSVYSTYLELYACGIHVWICIDYMYVEYMSTHVYNVQKGLYALGIHVFICINSKYVCVIYI